MEAVSVIYDLGKPVDIPALARKVKNIELVRGTKLAVAPFPGFKFIFFPSGKIRLTFSSLEHKELVISQAVLKLSALLHHANSVLKLKNIDEIACNPREERLDETFLANFAGARNEKFINHQIFLDVMLASTNKVGDILMCQSLALGGEYLGRAIAKKAKLKSPIALLKLLKDYFQENGLGELEYKKIKKVKSEALSPTEFVVQLYGGLQTGLPQTRVSLIEFERGIFRGAFMQYYQQLNIFVRVTKCWCLGDTHSEFEIGFRSI